jgi:hypothetical protein
MSRRWALPVVISLSLLGVPSAYAQVDPTPIPVPNPTKRILLEVDVDTLNFRVVQPYRTRQCFLCSPQLAEKYGKDCAEAERDNINICDGLVNATVQNLNQIMLLRSHKNPTCFTIASTILGGTVYATQLCLCNATDPVGTCPSAMWIE